MKRFLYKYEVGKFDGLKSIFRSLRYRNYRLFFSGQSLSLIGTWVQRIAIPWLVYRLTGSAFLLGFVGFAGQIPTFILAPFAGVLTDRLNRYHIMIVSQILSMIQALALALLFFTNTIEVWNVLLLSVIQGCINAFDTPARQSFVIEMVEDKNDIGNAVALNSSMFNGARLVGPSIAGVLIASLGEGACFLINGISYIFVVISLLLMKVKPQEKKRKDTNIIKEFKEGFTYTFGFPPIRSIIILLTLISLMGMPFSVLMPIFAKDIFHGGSHIFGFLMGASGVGALIGAAYLASRKSVVGLEKLIPLAAVVFGLGLVSFSLSSSFPLSIILMIITGVGMIIHTACSNTILQTISDNDKRGRVMSFYTMAFMGTAPIGSFLAGSMASMIGAPATLLIGGIACVIGALVFAQKLPLFIKLVRPIYIQLGIIDNAANK
nr:MFS transporter [uncultured Bacteroides sp.]